MKHFRRVRGRSEFGFTLIELMIVVAIIGVLAALALPKFTLLVEKSREAATRGNQNALHGAIAIYYGDHVGAQPDVLSCDSTYTFSRYLESIPPVKATHSGIGAGAPESPSGTAVWHTTDESIAATGTGWRYSNATGNVFINSAATDSKNVPYSTYGY